MIANNPSLYKNGRITLADAYRNMGSKMRDYDWAASDARSMSTVPAATAAPPMLLRAAAPAAPAAARVTAPAPPAPWQSFKIPEAPAIKVPLGGAASGKPIMLQAPQADAGQDVRDRGIAHIATGGLGR